MNVTALVKTAVWMALFAGISAAGVKYVAVVETGMDERSGASSVLNEAEVALITAELRRVAVENLPRDKYNVMTSETVQSMGGAVLEECAEENCIITLGSKIGADYIVRGIVSKFGTKLTLSIELYETENGTLVASSEPIRSENKGELLEMAATASENMYRKFAGAKTLTARDRKKAEKAEKKEAAGSYTANTYNNNYALEYRYEDFSTGIRIATLGLNLLPGGLGSFLIMKDKVGGYWQLGGNALTVTGFIIAGIAGASGAEVGGGWFWCDVAITGVGFYGAGLYNIVRSCSYRKPHPQTTANANNFKPYDGLKLAVFPTESGDYKVYARYDYTF
jgi:TolB-like protein